MGAYKCNVVVVIKMAAYIHGVLNGSFNNYITCRAYCSLGLIKLTDESHDNVDLQEAIQHSLTETCHLP